MGNLPHRILQHKIDSEACKVVCSQFNNSWVLRDLTERDFGIDKMAEKFHDGYATGELLLLQVKGTENRIDCQTPKFSQTPAKLLLYSELFATPFMLFYCSLDDKKCYYLWLQEYIKIKLNYENPNWRKQGTVTVYFPKDNYLADEKSERHLSYIAGFPRYKDTWIDYYIALESLPYHLEKMIYYYNSDHDIDNALKGFMSAVNTICNQLESAYNIKNKISPIWDMSGYDKALELSKKAYRANAFPDFFIVCIWGLKPSPSGEAFRFIHLEQTNVGA